VKQYPILEFDEDRAAFIDPAAFAPAERLPERGVACFFQDVVEQLCRRGTAREIDRLRSVHETQPILELNHAGERLVVFNPGVGGPLSAARLDSLVAMGLKKVIACGSAGALIPELGVGQVVIPSAAVRDEGTSYHYLAPTREIDFDVDVMGCIEGVMRQREIAFVRGKTWTTDAIFRETRSRVEHRKQEGCVTVEMEAASLLAVAKFRGVQLGYLLHVVDSLAGDDWDRRSWPLHAGSEDLFWLAAAAVVRL
jgi:uridine phosphorylase